MASNIEPITVIEKSRLNKYYHKLEPYIEVYKGNKKIEEINTNSTHLYDFATSKDDFSLPTTYHLLDNGPKEFTSQITGVSGIIKQYFYFPCVVSYAKTPWGAVAIIRTKRKRYKGIQFVDKEWGAFLDLINLETAMERIEQIKNGKTEVKELSPEDHKRIVAKMI